MNVLFPYGRSYMEYAIPENRLAGVLTSQMHHYKTDRSQEELVAYAFAHPIDSLPLCELAVGKRNVVIIASDHTRPVPSKVIIPPMLAEIRKGNPDANISILIATGCHRGTTPAELEDKFGREVVEKEHIVIHDCEEAHNMVNLGTLPSGGDLIINKLAAEADLLVSEGFIEPHFFAGFSGGRKSVLPGIAARSTVMYNHNADFINSPFARTGILENNPIHKDMVYAAQTARLAFICNVIIDADKKVVHAVCGDPVSAHLQGCRFLKELCMVNAIPSDIVITTNGGYPLDQNIYQAVKGMTAAEVTVKDGGVIIMLAKSNDGHGGDVLYKTFKEQKDINQMMADFLATPRDATIADQWQSQILARILLKAQVIYVSEAPDEMVKDLHMIPAHSIEDAISIADELLAAKGIIDGSILAIPDGVSVMVCGK